ncbi:MAG: TetR/AcrR family transcriptional regulator [Gracilimonas sp.]
MGTQERKERERKQRRDQILNAAIELIGEQGFESTTMDEIAERAELSKGTLYLYYNDKATLHQAIKKRGLKFLHERFLEIIQQDLSGAELVKEMMHTFLNLITENTTFTKAMMLFENSNENDTESHQVVEDCTHLESELLMLLVRSIQIGKQDGSILSTINPKVSAVMIGFQMSGMLQFYFSGSRKQAQKILDEQQLTMSEMMDQFLNIQFSSTQDLTS